MTEMNPITGSILQSPIVQRQQGVEKATQIRQLQDTLKNTATQDEDEVEQSVVSAEELKEIGDERPGQKQKKGNYSRRPPEKGEPEGDGEHLDLRA